MAFKIKANSLFVKGLVADDHLLALESKTDGLEPSPLIREDVGHLVYLSEWQVVASSSKTKRDPYLPGEQGGGPPEGSI